jgi:hypothetical protein
LRLAPETLEGPDWHVLKPFYFLQLHFAIEDVMVAKVPDIGAVRWFIYQRFLNLGRMGFKARMGSCLSGITPRQATEQHIFLCYGSNE